MCSRLTKWILSFVWDKDEQGLTTIGGRLEGTETIIEALNREALEEAGLVLTNDHVPFASWFWESTNTYTIWFLSKVNKFVEMPKGFEKTGHVIMNFETAIQMLLRIEGEGERSKIIKKAGTLASQLNEAGNSR